MIDTTIRSHHRSILYCLTIHANVKYFLKNTNIYFAAFLVFDQRLKDIGKYLWPHNLKLSAFVDLQVDAYPSSLAQLVNGDWWEISGEKKCRQRRIETHQLHAIPCHTRSYHVIPCYTMPYHAPSKTNRDTSAPGSELPHYCPQCAATFCARPMTNPPQCVRQIWIFAQRW